MGKLQLKNIKNILFDLGGVILNIDFEKTTEAFKLLGLNNFDNLYTQCLNNDLFIKLEKGIISPEYFRNEIKKLSQKPISDKQIDEAWNSMILDFPEKNIKLLIKLKKHFNTYLMSNTNEIHYKFYNNLLFKTFGIKGLSELFIKEYYSHLTGLSKPDKTFFELILMENNLKPSETLFIDDNKINIDSATNLGINTYLLNKNETICDAFGF